MIKGSYHSDMSKSKNQLAHLGRVVSADTRFKMSVAHTGLVHSGATKIKIGQSRMGVERTPDTKLKLRLANLGKKHTSVTRIRISQSLKGRTFTDVHKNRLRIKRSVETRAKISRAKLGNHNTLGMRHTAEAKSEMSKAKIRLWQDTKYKARVLRASMLGRLIHPNRPETVILELLNTVYPREWRFVGDGSLIVAGKNPDFANINGQKKLIELFGNYWHRGQDPQDRIDLFTKYGFATLVVWEQELDDMIKVSEKIIKFANAPRLKTVVRMDD